MNIADLHSSRPTFLSLALFAAAYLAGSWYGRWLMLVPGSGVTLWPPSGLYLAVLLLSEKRQWPWWLLTGLPAEVAGDLWLFQFPLSASLTVYLGNMLEALVGAWLVCRWCRTPLQLGGLREVTALSFGGAVLSPAVSATLGAATLAALGRQEFAVAWPLWWGGDSAGVLVVAPLVLVAFEAYGNWREVGLARRLEAGTMLAVFVGVTYLVFTDRFPFVYVILLPLLWASLRFETTGAALTTFILASMAIRYTRAGLGMFANLAVAPEEQQWLVQFFLIVAALSGLVIAALTRQRRAALLALEHAYGELEARVMERTAAAQEKEERLRLFIEHAPAAVAMFDRTMRYLAVSRRWLDDYRLESEVLGRCHYEVFPEIPERWKEIHRRGLAGEVVTADEDRFDRGDGTVQWLRWEVRPWRMTDGAVGGIVIFTEDITERKRAEEASRRERSLLNSVMQATDVMLVFLDPQFNFVWVNPAYADTCKMRPEEMVGKNHFALYPGAENEAIFRKVRDSGEAVFFKDKPFVFPDQPGRGVTYWDWSLTPVKDKDGGVAGLVFSLRETTTFKRAQESLRQSEERFRAIFKHAATGIAITDGDGRFLQCNPAYCQLLGYTAGELEQMAFPTLVHPDDRTANLAQVRRLMDGELPYFEIENRYLRKDGKPVWVHKFVSLLPDATGKPTLLVALVTDITERRRMEEALRDADRRKDEFLAMLAHELRNPLAPIHNAVYLLQRLGAETPADGRTRMLLTMIDRQVNHLTRLVDDLLDVSRIAHGRIELRKERIDLATIVGYAVDTSQPLIQAGGHELSVSLPPESLVLDADPVRLTQVLSNLLNNAAKYMGRGGNIWLTAERRGNEVLVSVRDTGVGIPAEMLPHVFDLFTQVHHLGDRSPGGLGIGLALVQHLVEMHGGRVEARSKGVGQGSEFLVRLPLAVIGSVNVTAPTTLLPALKAPRRILVVDDNQDAADSLGLLLESRDLEVRVVYDGPTALNALATFQPEVVLLDLGMPGMDGFDTARCIRQHPEGRDISLIALTGWGQDEERRRTREAGFDHHLVKPVDGDRLSSLLVSLERQSAKGQEP